MERENIPGQMAVGTKANTLMIKSMDLEPTHGLMAVSTQVTGKMESNTVKEYTSTLMVIAEQESGLRESAQCGWMRTWTTMQAKLWQQKLQHDRSITCKSHFSLDTEIQNFFKFIISKI